MPIREQQGQVWIVRLELSPAEIPRLLTRHAATYPGAHELETAGLTLVQSNFEPQASVDFVQRVCKWGRGDRNISRLLGQNSPVEISQALSEACELARGGEVAKGVYRIQSLRHLGQSFASKQLRFLNPGGAVILDSVIRTGLGYPATIHGYKEFLGDCQAILTRIRQSSQLSEPQRAGLRVSDIEAAIFAKLQGF